MMSSTAKDLSVASLSNCKELTKSADLLFDKGQIGHAFGLLTLASEELAKADMYSDLATGRKRYSETRSDDPMTLTRFDFTNHDVKDKVFAAMIVRHILAPLVLNDYLALTHVLEFGWEHFDPDAYQEYFDHFSNMDPGRAAQLLDPTGLSAKRMDSLVSLSLHIGKDKNDGFYVDFRNSKIVEPIDISIEDYEGFHEVISALIQSNEHLILSASPTDRDKSLSESLKDQLAAYRSKIATSD